MRSNVGSVKVWVILFVGGTLLALVALQAFANRLKPRAWLRDITEEAGITFRHENGITGKHRYLETLGGGVAMFDYNGDGWLDIYLVNGNHIDKPPSPKITNVLYRNNQNGTFTDVTKDAGVGDIAYGQGCCAADYDNDGDQDLYVTNFGPDRLYRNDGKGKFTDVAKQAGIDCRLFGQHCAFFDFDQDGWLDIYVQNYVTYDPRKEPARSDYASPREFPGAPDHLYRNNGDGTFTEVSKSAGIHKPDGRGMGASCIDLDGDHDADLFVANDAMENYYFANNGDGTFQDRSIRSGLSYDHQGGSESSMGVDVGDVDGDGRIDIVCPTLRAEGCTLYTNRGGTFEDTSRSARIATPTRPFTGFSPNLCDFDNDGDLDLFITNGGVSTNLGVPATAPYEKRYGIRDLLLINDGKGHFDLAEEQVGPYFGRELIGRGSAAGDIDNDGDVDLVIANLNGPTTLLINEAPHQNWITLLLEPTKGHRDPIGAKISVTAGGRTQTAIVRGGGSYLSLSDRRPHFGVGDAARIERIDIVWPDKTRQTLKDQDVNQFLSVTQE